METGNILREQLTGNRNRRKQRNGQKGQQARRKRRVGALHFSHHAEEGNHFINEVAQELGVSRNSAARITKAVLHAVRDKLPPDDAIEFAQGLPMALKAVYIEQYDISSTPVLLRNPHDFLDYIFYKDEFSANFDFPEEDSVERALQGVFRVLRDYMDPGQINQLRNILGPQIYAMIEGKTSFYRSRQPLRLEDGRDDPEYYFEW